MVFCFVFSLFGTAVPTQAAKLTKAQKKAYMKVIKKEVKNIKKTWDESYIKSSDNGTPIHYAFFDVDKNGIKDLVVQGGVYCSTKVFTYKKGKVKKILDCKDCGIDSTTCYNDKYLINSGSAGTSVYKRSKGLKVVCSIEDYGESFDSYDDFLRYDIYSYNKDWKKLIEKYGFYGNNYGELIGGHEFSWKEYRLKL